MNWTLERARGLYDRPFMDLLMEAQTVHRAHAEANAVQLSALLSIKTGRCPENCSYCPQSAHYNTGLKSEPLMDLKEVKAAAIRAQAAGATRFCMGAAWRGPKDADVEAVCEMVEAVKSLGLESCATLGLLSASQAKRLKASGLDFYNHNIDTSPDFYPEIITTRQFEDRVETLRHARAAGLKLCCGGILGMGETTDDRLMMLVTLANWEEPPESIPINQLIPIPGTPLASQLAVDPLEVVRVIAVARLMMPGSVIRLSAGRARMDDCFQAWCFFAGANSVFHGDQLLTADNPSSSSDASLFARLGMHPMALPQEVPA
jgi:biotin synthase